MIFEAYALLWHPLPRCPPFPLFSHWALQYKGWITGKHQIYDVTVTYDVSNFMTSFNVIVTHLKCYITSLAPRLPNYLIIIGLNLNHFSIPVEVTRCVSTCYISVIINTDYISPIIGLYIIILLCEYLYTYKVSKFTQFQIHLNFSVEQFWWNSLLFPHVLNIKIRLNIFLIIWVHFSEIWVIISKMNQDLVLHSPTSSSNTLRL